MRSAAGALFGNALLILPVAVLAGAYAVICIHFASPWPFSIAIHEDGRHTLLGTIFYFEHALGELPIELLLSFTIAAALPLCTDRPPTPSVSRALLLGALATDLFITAGAIVSVGFRSATLWLLQFHTRDGVAPQFGSHWGYHLLSLASLMILAMALAASLTCRRPPPKPLRIAWLLFAALSLIFGLTAAPFVDPRYLGHQARETFTHALVTVPLAIWCCARLSCNSPWSHPSLLRFRRSLPWSHPSLLMFCRSLLPWRTHSCVPRRDSSRRPSSALPLAAFVLLALYQAAAAILAGASEHSQSTDPVRLVAVHFFEHTFSYLVVALHAMVFQSLIWNRTPPAAHST